MEAFISEHPWLSAMFGVLTLGTGAWPVKLLLDHFSPDRSDRLHAQGWNRASELEREIDLLRIALDRGRRRENGWSTAFELLVTAFEMPLEDRPRLVARAREILVATLKYGER